MRTILSTALLILGLAFGGSAQVVQRWSATTGDVVLAGAGTTATVQQPGDSTTVQVALEAVQVYCSVACNVTQAANGAAATTTAGTVIPLLPTQLNLAAPFNFFTASNVGAGTAQAGITHIPAGSTVTFCMNTVCGASQSVQLGRGTGSNYSFIVSSITGTANITFVVRTSS